MNRFFILTLFLSLFFYSAAQAAIYKGQREFVNSCLQCHKNGREFIADKKRAEWKKIMDNKGEELVRIHLNSSAAKDSYSYFTSDGFLQNVRNLEQFLLEYSKNSGKVPACN